ncbi:MAG: ABC transporter permease [Opitutaceae bacterium]|nr:ABC transporter permease [Opitutaceae bacterium]
MHPILTLLRKDFLHFGRNKAAVSLTFAVPFAMIWLFGWIFGVNRKDSGPSGIPLAVVDASGHAASAKLIAALRAEKTFRVITEHPSALPKRPLAAADLRPLMEAPGARFRFALVLPADLVSDTRLGLHLIFLSNPRNEIETQTVNGILQKTIFSHVPELLGQSLQANARRFIGEENLRQFNRGIARTVASAFRGDADALERQMSTADFGFGAFTQSPDESLRRLDAPAAETTQKPDIKKESSTADLFSQIVKIDTEQVVGAKVKSPQATSLVGGWAIQFLLFAVSASAASLFRERDAGIFQRLLAAPVTRAHILWSKFLYGIVLGLVQLVVLFVASSWLYGIDVLPHLPLLALVCVFAAAACTSFGMLIAAVTSSPEAAGGLSTLVIMLMSAIGGAWFPISLMPLVVQQFSKLTLVYWSMEGFSAVLWAGQSLGQILPILAILGGITVAVLSLAIWRFNRGTIFG